MAIYGTEEKDAFTVMGVGVELKSDYTDQAGLDKEKEDFFKRVMADGTIDKLRKAANNDMIFAVNEAKDDKMMHYVGVLSNERIPEATHAVEFPAGKYIAVSGQAPSAYELADQLTKTTFGEVLEEEQKYAYVGGPNAAVIMGEEDNLYVGEMWIPVVEQ